MSVSTELLDLAREVQACDVGLNLLRADDSRNLEARRELAERRAIAAKQLAALEAEHGWQPADEPPPGE